MVPSAATSNNGHGPHLIGLHRPHHMAAVRTTTRTMRNSPTYLRHRDRSGITRQRSGQQLEAARVPWPDRVEVAAVECGDAGDPQPPGARDDSRVGGPEREVGVGLDHSAIGS